MRDKAWSRFTVHVFTLIIPRDSKHFMSTVACTAYARQHPLNSPFWTEPSQLSDQVSACITAHGHNVVHGTQLPVQASRTRHAWALWTYWTWNRCGSQTASDCSGYPHWSPQTYLWKTWTFFHLELLTESCLLLDASGAFSQIRHLTTHVKGGINTLDLALLKNLRQQRGSFWRLFRKTHILLNMQLLQRSGKSLIQAHSWLLTPSSVMASWGLVGVSDTPPLNQR